MRDQRCAWPVPPLGVGVLEAVEKHKFYLVPGFLGFVNLGRITYFGHVRRNLGPALYGAGLGRAHPRRAAAATASPLDERSTWPKRSLRRHKGAMLCRT